MLLYNSVKTPCIGVCSTGIGDQVCRGCKRFAHEVIDWNAYSHEQRQIIANRLESFVVQLVQNFIVVTNEQLLFEQIKHQQISFKPEQNAYCWVFDLLRAGANQIDSLDVYGLQLMPKWKGMTLAEIRDAIDKDFYALSCAYYDRYINPHFNLQVHAEK